MAKLSSPKTEPRSLQVSLTNARPTVRKQNTRTPSGSTNVKKSNSSERCRNGSLVKSKKATTPRQRYTRTSSGACVDSNSTSKSQHSHRSSQRSIKNNQSKIKSQQTTSSNQVANTSQKQEKYLCVDLENIYTALNVWSLNPFGWEFIAILRPREAIAIAKGKCSILDVSEQEQNRIKKVLCNSLILCVFPAGKNPNKCHKELSVSLEKVKTALKHEFGKQGQQWEKYLLSLFV